MIWKVEYSIGVTEFITFIKPDIEIEINDIIACPFTKGECEGYKAYFDCFFSVEEIDFEERYLYVTSLAPENRRRGKRQVFWKIRENKDTGVIYEELYMKSPFANISNFWRVHEQF